MPPTKRKANDLSGDDESSSAPKKISANSSRARTGPGATSTSSSPRLPDLPATAWGNVLDFLPYRDVRKALLLCRTVYFEGTKYVTELAILYTNELNVGVVRRFINVEVIRIGCVIAEDGALNPKAVGRVVPFMTTFPKLNSCRIGGFDERCINTKRVYYALHKCVQPHDHSALYRNLLVSLCSAFESNALLPSIRLHGFITGQVYSCSPTVEASDHNCRLCRRIINCFPLNKIISIPGTNNNRPHKTKHRLCIPHDQCLAIIRSRTWTNQCARHSHPRQLLKLTKGKLNTSVLVRDNKTHRDVSYGDIFLIGSERLMQLELLVEVVTNHLPIFHREHKIPASVVFPRAHILKWMNKKQPTGGYILEKETFDRLVAAGFHLAESDFAAVLNFEQLNNLQ